MYGNEVNTLNRMKATAKREQTNMPIRRALAETGLYRWQLADLLGCSVETVQRMLRHELTEAESQRIVNLIKKNAKGV